MSAQELYEALIVTKKIERDRAQERLLAQFNDLEQRVVAHRSARRAQPIGWLFGSREREAPPRASTSTATSAAARPC